jgi:hypothetical protein
MIIYKELESMEDEVVVVVVVACFKVPSQHLPGRTGKKL